MPNGKERTHDEFVCELSKINANIEVVGIYQKTSLRLSVLTACYGFTKNFLNFGYFAN